MLWLGFKQENLFCDFVRLSLNLLTAPIKTVSGDIRWGEGGGMCMCLCACMCVFACVVCGEVTGMETDCFLHIFNCVSCCCLFFLRSDANSLVSSLKLCKINSLLLWFLSVCKRPRSLSVGGTLAAEGRAEKKRVNM